jgi:hypothetical protein
MSIINRGVFDSGTAFLRQVGNDWPRAQVITTAEIIESSSNLYFTNVRVVETVTPLLTTANVVETTNQYFTNVRVVQAVTPLLTTANVVETANALYFTNARVLSALIGSNVLVDNLVVSGDLEVQGNVVTLNTATLNVEDKNILLANGAATSSAADGAGILIAGAQANITYSNTGDKFVINKNTDFTGNVVLIGDVRASGNLIANGLIIRNIVVTDDVLLGNVVVNNITNADSISANTVIATVIIANTITTNIITAKVWNDLYTTNVIETANAQYFTNIRARSAFTAGKGVAISPGGIITNTGALPEYNLSIDGTSYGNVLSTMSSIVTFPVSPATDRFVLRSIHVTNMSDSTALLSSNVLYATSNTAALTNRMPLPAGASLELIDKNQILNPGDKINLQGFDSAGTATANLMTYAITYETFNNAADYISSGVALAASNASIQILHADTTFNIIESIKVVNLVDNVVPVKLWWGDANGLVKAFYIHNFPVPPNSSVEILQKPKRINATDKLYASYTNANASAISVFISARQGALYTPGIITSAAIPGNAIIASYSTTELDGVTLYYTIE